MLLNGVLRLVARRRFRPTNTASSLRRLLGKVDRQYNAPPGVNHRKEKIIDLDCEWFEPEDVAADAPLILYFPGGGFFLPAMSAHREMLVDLSRRNGCRALLAQYRLAPEYPLPTGQRDGLKMYRYLVEQLGYTEGQIFIAGDSAGGNVTLSTLLQARDAQLKMPAGAILLSPGSDLTMCSTSTLENLNKDPMFHISALLWMMKLGLPTSMASNDPLVSPSLGDYQGLPPLLFEVGSTEILRDHSTIAVDNARNAGVDVEFTVSPKSPHVYPVMKFLPEAKAARQRMSTFINRLRPQSITESGNVDNMDSSAVSQ